MGGGDCGLGWRKEHAAAGRGGGRRWVGVEEWRKELGVEEWETAAAAGGGGMEVAAAAGGGGEMGNGSPARVEGGLIGAQPECVYFSIVLRYLGRRRLCSKE